MTLAELGGPQGLPASVRAARVLMQRQRIFLRTIPVMPTATEKAPAARDRRHACAAIEALR